MGLTWPTIILHKFLNLALAASLRRFIDGHLDDLEKTRGQKHSGRLVKSVNKLWTRESLKHRREPGYLSPGHNSTWSWNRTGPTKIKRIFNPKFEPSSPFSTCFCQSLPILAPTKTKAENPLNMINWSMGKERWGGFTASNGPFTSSNWRASNGSLAESPRVGNAKQENLTNHTELKPLRGPPPRCSSAKSTR